ncbi:MAG: carboxypeptidase regulatory-like domain-containing protein [Acidobacteriota bacterium]
MVVKRALPILLSGVLALALSLPGAALAQTASGIRGLVVDKDGEPIVAATVLVENRDLGISQQGTVTDARGQFRVAPLPPGRGYTVTVSFPGMATVILSDIEVRGSGFTSVPVTLRPDKEMRERVRVTAVTDVVDTASTTTQTSFSDEFIDALPILGRNYQDVLSLAPGVTDVDGDGNPNILGARDTDTITLVDGVSTVDPLTGQRGQELNIESIAEIEVKTSGASAEFSRGQGGFVNIITKSGGNDFQGRFSFFWRSNIFDGDGAGLDDPKLHGGLGELGLRDLDFNDFRPFLSLSGPIRKDKAWYFFSAQYIQEEVPVNALTQAFVRGHEEFRVFGKLSWDINPNNKLSFTVNIDPQQFNNLGLNSFTQLESGYTVDAGATNLVLTETSVFNPNVFLETRLQYWTSTPELFPTLDPDTNGNGVLFIDRNGDGFIDGTERDPGEDFDRDGRFDVFEDRNGNKVLDEGEDLDGDGRLTAPGACEGANREDIDCDGHLDFINEDQDGDGKLDPGEDLDGDGRLDDGTEDRNGNQLLDDRPFVAPDDFFVDEKGNVNPTYPYGSLNPLPNDLDYSQDQRTLRISGPYYFTINQDESRVTLREDLTVFVPDWFGQHDLRLGAVIEKEDYKQATDARNFLFPNASPPTSSTILPTTAVRLPSENRIFNEANNTTFGAYFNDVYKPLPNLTLGIGLRFDREATDSFGFTQFDPAEQRRQFDTIFNLGGGEQNVTDESQIGNNDGIISQGFCGDPIFSQNTGVGGNVCTNFTIKDEEGAPHGEAVVRDHNSLRLLAASRLTQHHISTTLVAETLAQLFPEAVDPNTGEINRDILREKGNATFQERESFRLTNNNLAPRLSISWDPWADGKTKLFANWSRFYDKLFLATVIPEEGPDFIYRYYRKDQDGVTGAGVPNNQLGAALSKAPPDASQVDRGLETPFTDELSIGFERELAPELSLRVTFIDRKGRNGLQDLDINHEIRCCEPNANRPGEERPIDVLGRLVQGSGAATGGGASVRQQDFRPDLYNRNFFFNRIFRIGNFNTSRYKSIQLQVTKRLSRKWQMDASYTYSRARGDAENFASLLGDDPATTALEFGYLDFDQRHVVKFNAVTFLPGDWELGGTLQWSSGLPFSEVDFFTSADNFDYFSFRRLLGRVVRGDKEPEFIPIRRNSLRNDAVYNIDVRASKAFVLGRFNAKAFVTVQDLLNTDDLRISFFLPDNPNRGGALQLISERQFGRRFEVGFQFDF